MLHHQATTVDTILTHLCSKGIYGDVTEWCEMRGDCVIVVTCPDCRDTFTLDDDEYEELVRLSQTAQACGIRPLA